MAIETFNPVSWARRSASAFARRVDGGIAVMAAMVLPCLVMLAYGAVELAALGGERSVLQDAADGAALTGARELSVAGASAGSVEDRAEANALARLASFAGRAQVTAEATATDTQVKVVINSTRQSFFGNLLPPGGFKLRVDATAAAGGSGLPLCVLNLYSTNGAAWLYLKDASTLTAPGCVAHSNSSIYVDKAASLSSGQNQAVTAATGKITPAAIVPAARVQDPLKDRDIPTATCRGTELEVKYETDAYVAEGVHCGGIVVDRSATVTLGPGVHYFGEGADGVGDLKLRADSVLKGSNVVLVFGRDTTLKAQNQATVDLVGRQSGALAGMVIASTRDNTKPMELNSSNAKRLEGVIYLPATALTAVGDHQIAQESDWTVTVALGVILVRGAKLKINNRYAESTVPVPAFVGGQAGTVRLLD